MIVLGIIGIATALIVSVVITLLDLNDNISACVSYFCGVFMGVFIVFGCVSLCEGLNGKQEQTEFKYPAAEYTLEYEIVSRGEHVDSTYVITKLE